MKCLDLHDLSLSLKEERKSWHSKNFSSPYHHELFKCLIGDLYSSVIYILLESSAEALLISTQKV